MPEPRPAVRRIRDDRCPGALRLAEAADGFLARVRLPGGLVSAAQLRALARVADGAGDGHLELTSRGNVQLRGLPGSAAEALTGALSEAGLLPSLSHDRARNVLASPLAGLDRGPSLTGLVHALDAALCARPGLSGLSGRFLFAVDDGRGDVAGAGADVLAVIRPGGADVNGLWVPAGLGSGATARGAAGRGASVPPGLRDLVVAAMLACAEAFLDLRAEAGGTAWRIADLPGGAERVRASVAARLGLSATGPAPEDEARRPVSRPAGLIAWPGPARGEALAAGEAGDGAETAARAGQGDRASVVLLAPLGRLTSKQVDWVAGSLAGEAARVTPWRSVVLPWLADADGVLLEAAGLGFGTDEDSLWRRVTACAGRPGCASALADVRADAAELAERWPGRLVHVSGCGRHCGRPAATEIDVTATSEGYDVAGI